MPDCLNRALRVPSPHAASYHSNCSPACVAKQPRAAAWSKPPHAGSSYAAAAVPLAICQDPCQPAHASLSTSTTMFAHIYIYIADQTRRPCGARASCQAFHQPAQLMHLWCNGSLIKPEHHI
eukprot:GHRQ01029206.1.p2 GENE.GHRQ01029206.1~~GHRQ01029206.1.p2  ORF type:complete len:122 (-),score=25.74 GHRQ01029206.1:738-1103(-)